MKIANFKELKDYLNTRSDEDLEKNPLGVQRVDEWYFDVPEIWILDEDYYQSEEGVEPVSVFEGDPNDPEDTIDQFTIYPKGYIFFDASDVLADVG